MLHNRILSFLHALRRQGTRWVSVLVASLSLILLVMPAYALPQGNAITDSRILLRQALPITEPVVQTLDQKVLSIDRDLQYNRWSSTRRDVKEASKFIDRHSAELVAQLDPERQPEVKALLEDMQSNLNELGEQTKLKSRGKSEARRRYNTLMDQLTTLEDNWIGEFPYDIPVEYSTLPQLLGRAEVVMDTTQGSMTLTLDGYSAPITAGNFADLVQRGFYDGLSIDRVEDFYIIQAGDPPGPADGFVDPEMGTVRQIPMEIRVKEKTEPLYGDTLPNLGYWDAEPMLPFSAAGTLAMARYPDDPNSASSQFFIFIAEPDLTPAGLNLMDGRYSTFGYITDGLDVMYDLRPEDKILSAYIVSGSQNLQ